MPNPDDDGLKQQELNDIEAILTCMRYMAKPLDLSFLSSLLRVKWQYSPVWFIAMTPYLLFSHPVPEEWQFSLITSHLNPPSGDFTALQQSN